MRANQTRAHVQVRETSPKAFLALGRLKTGAMNKTEQAYEASLKLRQMAGEIAWYKFEGVKLRLADNTFYSPDFAVMLADGSLEMHEVKGARAIFRDDARVKIKVASDLYPFKFIVFYPLKARAGGGWEQEDIR